MTFLTERARFNFVLFHIKLQKLCIINAFCISLDLKAIYLHFRLFVYEDNHSIRKDEYDIDCTINCALWFLEHNGES